MLVRTMPPRARLRFAGRVLVSLLVLFACNAAPSAPPTPASPAPEPSLSTPAPSEAPITPELVTFSSGALTLAGVLYQPPGLGPFPAIVFNHGSEEYPGSGENQAMFYVRSGFVLFMPHRRGHGRSKNAGAYISTMIDPSKPDSTTWVDALVAQTDDVMAAIAYVASLPYVDAKRVATVGCSFGGIMSLFAAERGTGIVAAVDFAGGAIMWAKTAPLRERMKVAARNAKVPVLFLQAENDYDTAPSRVLSEEMKKAGKPMRVRIFPPRGTTPQAGHGFCAGGENPPWGTEVLAFLADTKALPNAD